MIKTRLFAVIALLGLIVIIFSACSEPTPSPTPATETAIQNAVEARNAALAHLQTANADTPWDKGSLENNIARIGRLNIDGTEKERILGSNIMDILKL